MEHARIRRRQTLHLSLRPCLQGHGVAARRVQNITLGVVPLKEPGCHSKCRSRASHRWPDTLTVTVTGAPGLGFSPEGTDSGV